MENFDVLLKEAFHTYQVYLDCAGILNGAGKMALCKWPDIAQSSLIYINLLEAHAEEPELEVVRKMIYDDYRIAIVEPIRAIYRTTRDRFREVLETEPAVSAKIDNNPITCKNNLIGAINKMFGALNAVTGIEYPEIKEYVS
jgi:hypothetical protein